MFNSLRNNSHFIIYLVVAAFVVTGGFMGYGAYMNNNTPSSQSSSGVVAKVNGEEILQQEYLSALQQQAPQTSQMGRSQIIPFRYRILNSLIEREIILQKADELGIDPQISETEVQQAIDDVLKQNKMSQTELEDVLAEQDYSLEEFRGNIKESLALNKKIQQTVENSYQGIEVTEEEIKSAYDKKYPAETEAGTESAAEKAEKTEKTPAYADVKEKIKNEVLSQKHNAAFSNWMAAAREEAEIEILDPVLSAYHALINQNYEAAATQFSALIEQNPSQVLYTYLAEAQSKAGDNEAAVNTFNKALEKYPEDWQLHMSFGNYYNNQDNKELAIKQLSKASELAGDDFMAHYQLYMLFSSLGAKEKAEQEMELIKKLNEKMKEQQEQSDANPEGQ